MSACSIAGHPQAEKHDRFHTGKSGQWVDMGTHDEATPVLGTHVRRGGSEGILTSYCADCLLGLIEQFD